MCYLQNIFVSMLFVDSCGNLRQKRFAHQLYNRVDSIGNLSAATRWSLCIIVQQLFRCHVRHTSRSPIYRQSKCYTRNELLAKRGNYSLRCYSLIHLLITRNRKRKQINSRIYFNLCFKKFIMFLYHEIL